MATAEGTFNVGQRYLRAIPGPAAKILERCGHLPEMEQPEAFVRVVLDFLAPASVSASR